MSTTALEWGACGVLAPKPYFATVSARMFNEYLYAGVVITIFMSCLSHEYGYKYHQQCLCMAGP